jgi:hypothetical protein
VNHQILFPFQIFISRNASSIDKLAATRLRAFGGHAHPVKGTEHFRKDIEALDGALLMTAESKTSGECLGSLRIEANLQSPFYFESEISTPELVSRTNSLYISRLNTCKGPLGVLTRTALLKALFLYATANQCKLIFAFVDPVRLRLYRPLGFEPAIQNNPLLPLDCHDGTPMHLIQLEIEKVSESLQQNSPQLKAFLFDCFHPDIKIFSSVTSRAISSRSYDKPISEYRKEATFLPNPAI